MINSYGPWVDTNVVYPMGPNECQVRLPGCMGSVEDCRMMVYEKAIVQQPMGKQSKFGATDALLLNGSLLCCNCLEGLCMPAAMEACDFADSAVDSAVERQECLVLGASNPAQNGEVPLLMVKQHHELDLDGYWGGCR